LVVAEWERSDREKYLNQKFSEASEDSVSYNDGSCDSDPYYQEDERWTYPPEEIMRLKMDAAEVDKS